MLAFSAGVRAPWNSWLASCWQLGKHPRSRSMCGGAQPGLPSIQLDSSRTAPGAEPCQQEDAGPQQVVAWAHPALGLTRASCIILGCAASCAAAAGAGCGSRDSMPSPMAGACFCCAPSFSIATERSSSRPPGLGLAALLE
jgi:hypothetical protein